MAKDIKAVLKDMQSKAKALETTTKKQTATAKKIGNEMKKGTAIKLTLTGLEKAYLDAIKSADGLTSARPATLKAAKAAEKALTKASINAACSAIDKHIADVEKDNKAEKSFKAFKKNMLAIAASLKKLA
jgi:hypothetical protein